jgi:hypothetical protein
MPQLIDLGKLRFFFAGEYNNSTTYEINDVVKYGGNVYIYISVVSAAGNLPTDTAYWSLMLRGINFEGPYVAGTNYQVGDGVAHGGKVYIAIANSQNITPPNVTYWSQFVDGIQYEGTYSGLTTYQKNDVVKYGGKAYIAKVDGAGNLPTNTTYWDKLVDGIAASGVYNNATAYVPGDVVAYGANTFIATAETTGNVPTNTTYWAEFTGGIDYRGEWATTTQYYPNDVVNRGGRTYICLLANISGTFTADVDAGKWQAFNGGLRITGDFQASTNYFVGDVVFDGISSYVANEEFTSGATVSADSGKWDLLAQGADYLPGQVGNQGKLLSTDGTDPLWTYEVNTIYVGDGAQDFDTDAALTNSIAVFAADETDYSQVAAYNAGSGAGSSTDFIAYSNNGDDNSGYIDMGITASTFDDPEFTITGPNDGYIFMVAPEGVTKALASYSISSNVATITTTTAHGFTNNSDVNIAITDTSVDPVVSARLSAIAGVKNITTTGANTFTVPATATDVTTTSFTTASATLVTGNGNLVLATGGTGSQNRIVFAAGGLESNNNQMQIIPDTQVHIEISTTSTSPSTGALVVAGGVGVQGDINSLGNISLEGFLYVGNSAKTWGITTAQLTNPVSVYRFNNQSQDSSYAQIAFQNVDPTSSTDIIVYMNNGTDDAGFWGMGITGSQFDDTTYGITGPGDFYMFGDTVNDTYKGNMVFATGESGSENKIVFAAGGYSSGNTQMVITPDLNVHIEIPTPSTSATTGALTIVGGVGISGDMNILGDVNIAGTITFGGSGTTVETENLAVADPFIFIASNNPANALDFGILGESNLPTTLDPQASVTTKAIVGSTDTVTLGITYTPGSEPFKVNDTIVVTGVDSTINGTRVVTAVTSNSVSFVVAGTSDLSQVAATTAIPKNVTLKSLTNAVATLTTSVAHTYLVGESVTVAGVDATFNGTYTITEVTSGTFSYAKIAADVTETAATTALTATITNKELTSNVATLTTSAAHGYQVGESVVVSNVNATFDGTYTITSVTSTTFSYSKTDSDVPSSPSSGDALVNGLRGTANVNRLLGAVNATDVLRTRYSGLAKDVTDGTWKLYSGGTTKPVTTVNFAEAGVAYDPLRVGSLTAETVTILNAPSASTDGANKAYVDGAAGGAWQTKTSNYTLAAGEFVYADSSGGRFTLTLPTSPAVNAKVRIHDLAGVWNTYPVTVARNGTKIMNKSEDLLLDVRFSSVELVYSGATYGWRLF